MRLFACNVTNSTARPGDREAVVTGPITAGTDIVAVSNASPEDSLRFVWVAVDGTGYTLLSDFVLPGGTGDDSSGNSSNSVGGFLELNVDNLSLAGGAGGAPNRNGRVVLRVETTAGPEWGRATGE